MATGSLSLLEAAKGEPTKIKRGVIQTIIQESALIPRLPWQSFEGSALQHEVEETLPDVAFREVNESWTKSYGTTSFVYWGVAIMGGEVKVDNFIVKVMGSREDQKAKQFAALAKANSMRFDYEFFDGTGANKGFKGVKTLIDEGFGQKFANSTVGAGLSIAKMDEARDLFKNQGDADEIIVNRTTRRRLSTYLKSTAVGTSLWEIVTNTLGKRVPAYDGIPLNIIGQVINSSNAVVDALRFDEDPGDAGLDTNSLYFIKYGENDVSGLLGVGGSFDVVDFGEQQADPAHMGRLEWYPGIAVFNKYSIVRLYGILDAAATA